MYISHHFNKYNRNRYIHNNRNNDYVTFIQTDYSVAYAQGLHVPELLNTIEYVD